MHLLVLATDYDGTLAENGRVSAATRAALKRLKDSGRKLVLISGRELEDPTARLGERTAAGVLCWNDFCSPPKHAYKIPNFLLDLVRLDGSCSRVFLRRR
jgi:trehalose-6-phosphatase